MPHSRSDRIATLVEMLDSHAIHRPDKLAFVFLSNGEQIAESVTFDQLRSRARSVGAWLQENGAQGHRALLSFPPGLDFIVAMFGCFYSGTVAVPLNPPSSARQIPRLESIALDSAASFALTTSEFGTRIQTLLKSRGVSADFRWCAIDHIADEPADWVGPHLTAGDTAILQYTSGSTSDPKGVVLNHRNVLHNAAALQQSFGGDENDVCVSWLPLHHDMGLIGMVLGIMSSGATTYLMSPRSFIERPMRWLERISEFNGTVACAPNFAYELCAQDAERLGYSGLDLSCLRTAMSGAESVRPATLDRFAVAFRAAGFDSRAVRPVYGLAEATLIVSGGVRPGGPVIHWVDKAPLRERRTVEVAAHSDRSSVFVGCGWAQNGQRIAIVDPDTSRVCNPDEIGEIWVAGDSVAQGYWRNPQETERVFAGVTDAGDGPFLRTGDLGFLLGGELHIAGRLKDLIIIRGVNYYPDDIESSVQESHSAVVRGRGAAFASDVYDDECLVIAQEVDSALIGEAGAEEVLTAIRRAVALGPGLPVEVVVLVEAISLPTTSSGKIKRSATRESFKSGSLAVVAEWRRPRASASEAHGQAVGSSSGQTQDTAPEVSVSEMQAWIADEIAATLGLPMGAVANTEPFVALGLDSVQAAQMMRRLAVRLSRPLSPTLPYDFPTVVQLAEALVRTDDVLDSTDGPGRPEQNGKEPIAVVGIGCRFPGAETPEQFWSLLCRGADAVGPLPPTRLGSYAADGGLQPRGGFLRTVDMFDAEFFGISPREAEQTDPQQRLLLEVAAEALDDAGIPLSDVAGTRTGVFIGISNSDYGRLIFSNESIVDAYTGTGNALSVAANRISYQFDLIGPSIAIDTACSSSLVAIHQACRSLRDGEATLALAGGVNLVLSSAIATNFSRAGLMSADGRCKTFDARADGITRGEGAGVVILKPLSKALSEGDRIYAVIQGSATNQDGRTNGLMAPSPRSQRDVLRQAYLDAGLSPGTVQYVEAHGTGTLVGDLIEATALGAVMSDGRTAGSRCLVGSVKPNIGHLEAAAGVAGLIKAALCLHHRMVPQNVNFHQPNPDIDFEGLRLRVPRTTEALSSKGMLRAGVSSFGFGGTNAHAILASAPEPVPYQEVRGSSAAILTLSARSPSALQTLGERYRDTLATGAVSWTDLAYTSAVRRTHHEYRLPIVASSTRDALAQLDDVLRTGDIAGRDLPAEENSPIVFVFSGQGSHWFGMARQLLNSEPAFAAALASCETAFAPHVDWSLIGMLSADESSKRIHDIDIVHPLVFAVQVALARLWQSWGVVPNAVIGHSMGEIAAAHVAGALTLDDSARIVCIRAALLQTLAGKGQSMAAVELSADELGRELERRSGVVSIAAINGPESTVMSGENGVLNEIIDALRRRDVHCKVLLNVAGHSPQMEPIAAELHAALADVQPVDSDVAFYSTVTGQVRSGGSLEAGYWAQNIVQPVMFDAAVRLLVSHGYSTFVELSPHPILLGAMREAMPDRHSTFRLLPTLRRNADERATMLSSAGELYLAGHAVAWDAVYADGGTVVDTPLYPWQRTRHWIESPPGHGFGVRVAPDDLGRLGADDDQLIVDAHSGDEAEADSEARRSDEPKLFNVAAKVGPAARGSTQRSALLDSYRAAPPEQGRAMLLRFAREQVARALGVQADRLDVHRSLKQLGLDSVIATELKSFVKRELSVSVPIAWLLEGPSATSFAGWLAYQLGDSGAAPPSEPDSDTAVIWRPPQPSINCNSDSHAVGTLILCHPGSGLSWHYSALAMELIGLNCVALQHPSYSTEFVADSIPTLAAFYADKLGEIDLTGPVMVAGWSFGGTMAHEVAVQLTQRSVGVQAVVNIDGHLLGSDVHETSAASDEQRSTRFTKEILQEFQAEASSVDADLERLMIASFQESVRLLKNHTPSHFPGTMAIVASDVDRNDSPLEGEIEHELVRSWTPYVAEPIRSVRVPCRHGALLRDETSISTIASTINAMYATAAQGQP